MANNSPVDLSDLTFTNGVVYSRPSVRFVSNLHPSTNQAILLRGVRCVKCNSEHSFADVPVDYPSATDPLATLQGRLVCDTTSCATSSAVPLCLIPPDMGGAARTYLHTNCPARTDICVSQKLQTDLRHALVELDSTDALKLETTAIFTDETGYLWQFFPSGGQQASDPTLCPTCKTGADPRTHTLTWIDGSFMQRCSTDPILLKGRLLLDMESPKTATFHALAVQDPYISDPSTLTHDKTGACPLDSIKDRVRNATRAFSTGMFVGLVRLNHPTFGGVVIRQ